MGGWSSGRVFVRLGALCALAGGAALARDAGPALTPPIAVAQVRYQPGETR